MDGSCEEDKESAAEPPVAFIESIAALPEDLLYHTVDMLTKRHANRPEFVAALCACNRQLRSLLPCDLRQRYLEATLPHRPSSADLRSRGLLKSPFERRLTKALATSAVSRGLSQRESAEALVDRGVLKAPPGTQPWLIQARESLRRAFIRREIQEKLSVVAHVQP